MTQQPHVPAPGVWVPAVTFFDPATDRLDLAAQKSYFKYLSTTGLTGLLILGTNAEALLLTRDERFELIKAARDAVGPSFPLMAGVSGHSTRQVLEYCEDAKAAGANYVLALPAAYFGKATTPGVVQRFFDDVATGSPLPVLIYNFPAVCNGVDLDSSAIAAIAKKNSNIVGVKLTCGSVAKITRLADTFAPDQFAVFGGQSDFLFAGLTVGSAGCIAAFANVFPKSLARIYKLYKEGKLAEALELQRKAAHAEVPIKLGSAATKYAAAIYSAKAAGIEGAVEKLKPRRPYEGPSEAVMQSVRDTMAGLAEVEAAL
ncbi:dihydrodipicolinate synthetase [Xylona heveae TC161]|uniref:Dihydrodipicolinate synthetase n=1 Tax=Xylona heveae (strain CBS 132557 / TC161) TaxID=1328760 RepID=A0A165A8E3_XYLHT|nr:dihydrodipicolinate synthetase [Xylona heveae TC161]KZF20093.1 dihydrodipicolinate synthetase [Xylona heveae TC161]